MPAVFLPQIEARITELQGLMATNQEQIVGYNNMIEVNVAQIEGQQEALVDYIEDKGGIAEERRAEFEAAVAEINSSGDTYEEKVEKMRTNLENFNVKLGNVENQDLAQQLVNGQTYQAMGAEAEAAADAESLTPATTGNAAKNRLKAQDLMNGAMKSNTFLIKDTLKVNNMMKSYMDGLTNMKNFKLKNITKIDPPVVNFLELYQRATAETEQVPGGS